jgi:hypothetical protein
MGDLTRAASSVEGHFNGHDRKAGRCTVGGQSGNGGTPKVGRPQLNGKKVYRDGFTGDGWNKWGRWASRLESQNLMTLAFSGVVGASVMYKCCVLWAKLGGASHSVAAVWALNTYRFESSV